MLAGVFLAMLLDGYLLYRMFDTEVFPATGAWPPGAAAAEAIRAGDEGGRKAVMLGRRRRRRHRRQLASRSPMSAFGVAFIGNIWALDDVRHRPAAPRLFDAAVRHGSHRSSRRRHAKAYVPHGMMVGRRHRGADPGRAADRCAAAPATRIAARHRRQRGAPRARPGQRGYMLIAVVIAMLGGLIARAFDRHAGRCSWSTPPSPHWCTS